MGVNIGLGHGPRGKRKLWPRAGLAFLSERYQSNFSPNCTWRAVVDVLVIAPAVPERPVRFVAVGGVNTMRLGVLKLARFKMLKISARNCRLSRSRIAVFLRTEKSQVASPGPIYVSLPALPKNPMAEGGAINAAGLNHWLG